MARFEYVARDAAGRSASGELAAPSEVEAVRLLRADGKFVVALKELAERLDTEELGIPLRRRRVSKDEVINFALQLSIMVETGVPLTDAIGGMMDQTQPGAFRKVLADLLQQLESGQEFSAALARHPKAFGSLFVNLVRASEASGALGPMLKRCASHLTDQRNIRRSIRGAMLYPLVVLVMCIGVTIFLMTYLMPKFTTIYAGKEATLPRPTLVLMAISDWLTGWWMVWAPATVATVTAAWMYLGSLRGRPTAHLLLMRLPVVGAIYRGVLVGRCMRTLGTLVDAGVSMLDSVAITKRAVANHHFELMWDRVNDRLHRGDQLSAPLWGDPLMPRPIVQMIHSGERSGQLGYVLSRVADFLEEETRARIQTATRLVEPALMIVMGVIVGGIAIALLLPIFTISRVIAH